MQKYELSSVEQTFSKQAGIRNITTKIPYITVDNFPKLGLFTALRFIEWISENPEGVISLPTGKTPEYFIKWTKRIIDNWEESQIKELRKSHGLTAKKKPGFDKLHFVQIDEFYPIRSTQHNSFYHYVNEYYIKGFGLNPDRALLINSDTIPLPGGKHFTEIFPDNIVDLSLRYKEARTAFEAMQQKAVFAIDDWCTRYEKAIKDKGGIGFFLGGIGPDGHIAFNTRGSDHHSTTRLTATNFETQAVAAGDLGGIEVSRNRLVITVGLRTITQNPDAVAIIFAAGEAKAPVVKDALEKDKSNIYPSTALHDLRNSRFYLTTGAASMLEDKVELFYRTGGWTHEKTERAVIDLCKKLGRYGHHLTVDDLKKDKYCSQIPGLNNNTVKTVIGSINDKISRGMDNENNQVYYHTGPHHDDIMLGILPHIHRLLRNENNTAYFSVLTSGFTAVTNSFLRDALEDTKQFLNEGLIQMIEYPDFFEMGYGLKWDKDVYHFLNKVASGEPFERRRGLAHRIVRSLVVIYKLKDREELRNCIDDILSILRRSYDGEKNHPDIQTLKGMIREFEEELVWAHFGVQVKNVHHLRLGFYTGDVFTAQPERDRDVKPILEKLKKINPSVISLAFDPEGSGPDTHYKVLQAIADAVRLWEKETDLSALRIWGYRNVWYKFHPAEANVIVPVSLNAMAVLEDSFTNCYLSQVDASFPSYQHDGKFSELTKNTWVDQLKTIQLLLGKNWFYQSPSPRIRSTHGMLYFKEMTVSEFLESARELEKSMEGITL
ncbi:MAG: glucosamine-6-phosphate isomerase [Marinilabiliales bacterium]|nr:MAG: glucosamine-6-phosphate isomerase [Marinilabiliales bacterium]